MREVRAPRRLLIALTCSITLLFAGNASAMEDVPLTGAPVWDVGITLVNVINKKFRQIEEAQNILQKKTKHLAALGDQQSKAKAWLADLKKELQVGKDKLYELEQDRKHRLRQARGDRAKEAKIEAEFQKRKLELRDSQALLTEAVGKMRSLQTRLEMAKNTLIKVTNREDWYDPRTGKGRLRAQFQIHRRKIEELTKSFRKTTEKAKELAARGSSLDIEKYKPGQFLGRIEKIVDAKGKRLEVRINGKLVKQGAEFSIADTRQVEVLAKIVGPRRTQARELAQGKTKRVKVHVANDYELKYSAGSNTSHWQITEEDYKWSVATRTSRPYKKSISSSKSHAKVKDDVLLLTFSPDTVTERFTIHVSALAQWELSARRGGRPFTDLADDSGSGQINISIYPRKSQR